MSNPSAVFTTNLGSDDRIVFTYGTPKTAVTPFKGSGKGIPEIFVATLVLIDLGIKCDGPKEVAILFDHVCDPQVTFGKDELRGKTGAARSSDFEMVDRKDDKTKGACACVKKLLNGRTKLRDSLETVRPSYSDVKRYMERNHTLCWPTQGGKRETSLI